MASHKVSQSGFSRGELIRKCSHALMAQRSGSRQVDGTFVLTFAPAPTKMLASFREILWSRVDPPGDMEDYKRVLATLDPRGITNMKSVLTWLASVLDLRPATLEFFLVYGPVCPCGDHVLPTWSATSLVLTRDKIGRRIVLMSSRDPKFIKRMTSSFGPAVRAAALSYAAPAQELQQDWARAERHFKLQSSQVRVRTWAIGTLTAAQGGVLGVQEAVESWNEWFPATCVRTSDYRRDARRLAAELELDPVATGLLSV